MSNVDNVLFLGEENQKREELEEKGTGAEKKKKSVVICEYHDAKDKQV